MSLKKYLNDQLQIENCKQELLSHINVVKSSVDYLEEERRKTNTNTLIDSHLQTTSVPLKAASREALNTIQTEFKLLEQVQSKMIKQQCSNFSPVRRLLINSIKSQQTRFERLIPTSFQEEIVLHKAKSKSAIIKMASPQEEGLKEKCAKVQDQPKNEEAETLEVMMLKINTYIDQQMSDEQLEMSRILGEKEEQESVTRNSASSKRESDKNTQSKEAQTSPIRSKARSSNKCKWLVVVAILMIFLALALTQIIRHPQFNNFFKRYQKPSSDL